MGLNKDQLVLDTAALAESDNVGAYIRAADGTLITKTTVGGKDALDVNVVSAIDISLSHTTDSIAIGDGTDLLAINADGSINAVVSATNLDIRDLAFATDKVDVSGSTVALDATTLAALETINVGNNVTVQATSLDIRALAYGTDNVAIKGATGNQLAINADGSINAVVDVQVSNGSDKLEDSAHVSGDVGTYILSVREDVLSTSTSASGDYQSVKTDALGRTYVNGSAQTAAFSAVAVDATVGGVDLVATDLANRRKILIQNVSSKAIFIGNSGVTVSTGIKVPAASSAEFEVSENCNLFGITASGSADVRIMEIA